MSLILASASPRRNELLRLITTDFFVAISEVDEALPPDISPREAVERLSRLKAQAVALLKPNDVIIGSDTVVALENKIFGKPRDRQDAITMLQELSGRTHTVYTGVCIWQQGEECCFSKRTNVTFAKMDKREIEDYVASGESDDKAGAYGIQGLGSRYIEHIEGDYYTVMGLPVQALYQALRQKGLLPSL